MANSINYNVLCFSRDPNNNITAHRSVDNKLLTYDSSGNEILNQIKNIVGDTLDTNDASGNAILTEIRNELLSGSLDIHDSSGNEILNQIKNIVGDTLDTNDASGNAILTEIRNELLSGSLDIHDSSGNEILNQIKNIVDGTLDTNDADGNSLLTSIKNAIEGTLDTNDADGNSLLTSIKNAIEGTVDTNDASGNSLLNSIKSELTLIKNNSIEPLRNKNISGKCFADSSHSTQITLSTNNGNWVPVLFLYLPARSTKKAYIYNIVSSIFIDNTNVPNPFRVGFSFHDFSTINYSGGTSFTIQNLNKNSSNTSNCLAIRNQNSSALSISGINPFEAFFVKHDGTTVISDYQEEHIILKPNTGISISFYHNDNGTSVNFSPLCSIRWYEE